jgi:hypothetical protein
MPDGQAARSGFPALTLPALDGPRRDLSRVPQPMLVVFGHAECETTRLLLPFAERIHRARGAGTEVVLVLQDTPEDARAAVRELALTLPVLLDPEPWALGMALGARTVPLTLFVRAGVVEESWPAFRRADLERAAARVGVSPLFTPEDKAPALRPG